MTIAISLHILSAIVWIGGMFFAIMVLRLAAGDLEPKDRLPLWGRTFKKFFPWVWAAILILLITGYWMVFGVWRGFSNLPIHIHVMHGLGWLMVFIYLHLWFAPYRRFKQALVENNFPEGAKSLNQIRLIVTTNLVLGLIVAVVGASGGYL